MPVNNYRRGLVSLFLRVTVRVDQIPRFVLRRGDDHLRREVAKILYSVAFYLLGLDQQHSIFPPLTLCAALYVAAPRFLRGLSGVIGEHVVLGALGCLDRVA